MDIKKTALILIGYQNDYFSEDGILREVVEESPERLKGLKVLLAEDNPVNQLVTKDLLHTIEVEVVLAGNGVEAIRSLDSLEFDIVLMDIQMPVMDGYAAMKHIRTKMDLEKANIPILALTAHATEGEMEKCKNAGANDCLSKPFNPQDLFAKISELVGESSVTPGRINGNTSGVRKENKLILIDKLRDFTGGKVQLMLNTLGMLITELPKNLQAMQNAAEGKDWGELRSLAHKMKPNMMLIGARTQKEVLQHIEQEVGKRISMDEIKPLIDQIAIDMSQIIKELGVEVGKLKLKSKGKIQEI